MPPIEQNKVKRAGTGLKGWDVERACPGYTLFTPFNDENQSVYLIDLEGTVVWEWRCWEHLDPTADRIIATNNERDVWAHSNSVAELPDGNILISFRAISTVAMISRQTGEITWRIGAPPLAQQHSATPLSNGNILVFDNGPHWVDNFSSFSRILEIDPATKEIVWTYQEKMPLYFFSGHISGAQRLPNGNTLICEGAQGGFFEVTSEKDVVWEYISPHFGTQKPRIPEHNWVYRVYRHGEDEIARARATGSAG